MPETKPDLTFDQKGKCSACIAFDKRKNIVYNYSLPQSFFTIIHQSDDTNPNKTMR